VLNHAVRNIPADRMRLHICWGNYEGPHDHDIALAKVAPILLKAKPAALVIEAANPRHEHEWSLWRALKLPDDKKLIAGVIDTSTNYVEHPELIAQRIERLAGVVGRERVIAGTDCGFGTFAGYGKIDPSIAFKKLAAMVEGAALATKRLWAKPKPKAKKKAAAPSRGATSGRTRAATRKKAAARERVSAKRRRGRR
jgi:5-methyltetrahydropteroyltriglutamate--homocysteine methyltransferase